MKKTYLFYDIETTGLNKAFDQVLQFAAIRTDENLNEIDQHEFHIKLSPDVIPSPQALLAHEISIKDMLSGLPEVEVIFKIHSLMNTKGTISIGYNNLNFDDEFLRFSFYRNLLDPYTHQYANNCGRADLYPMIVMYFLYNKDILIWPEIENKTSLRLEHLASANKINFGKAHDAMVDVKVTLELARILYKEHKMWNYVLGYFDKKIDFERQQTYKNQVLMIDGSFGQETFYQAPMLCLGAHNHYKNKVVWLRLDKEELANTNIDSIAVNTWAVYKKFGENYLLLPFVEKCVKYLSKTRLDLVAHNIAWLGENPNILKAIADYHRNYTYPKLPYVDADAMLYERGFLSIYEQELCQNFHNASLMAKNNIIDRFADSTLQELAIRILGRNYISYLTEPYYTRFKNYLNKIFSSSDDAPVDYKGNKRYMAKMALEEISLLLNDINLDLSKRSLLLDLKDYILKFFSSI